eukprot:symbB.v1.2.032393.t1/scaffold3887.1/size48833/2
MCDTSEGFCGQLEVKALKLRTIVFGDGAAYDATAARNFSKDLFASSSLDEVLLWPLGTVTAYAHQWPSLRFASPPLQIPNPHLLSNPRSKKQSTICPLCGKLYLLPEVGQLVRVLLLY